MAIQAVASVTGALGSARPAFVAPLSPTEAFDQMRERYQARRVSNNTLIVGDPGTGKTFSLRTARLPVLIYQFDPGGADGLQDMVDAGDVIVADFSTDDAGNPASFQAWERLFFSHQKAGLFDHVGTVVLDSVTMWSRAAMSAILAKNGRKFKSGGAELSHQKGSTPAVPELRDYGILKTTLAQYLGIMTGIASDLVVLGHQVVEKDEETGRILGYYLNITGTLRTEAPMLFNEVYFTTVKRTAEGPSYLWQTAPDNYRTARSRLSAGGKLASVEPQNFRTLMDKIGRPIEDVASV